MLEKLLTKETIRFSKEAENWEHAIRLSAEPLLENGSITEGYADACIETVKALGPYIVLVPLFAMPHAKAPEHVNRLGISYLNLEKPVDVLDRPDRSAKTFIMLATRDNAEHLDALRALGAVLSDETKLDRLIHATDVTEVLDLIKS